MVLCLCSFSDVPKTYWGYDEIEKAYNLGIVKGYDTKKGYKGKFGPEDPTEKQQLSLMIYRVLAANGQLQTTEDLSSKYQAELTASKISSWAYKEVSYGFEYGLWTPEDFQEKGAFGGEAKIGRLLISKWLCNAAKLPISPIRIIEYTDVDGLNDYYGYLDALYRYDIMHGSSGKFSPGKDTSRAEASAVCVRLINRAYNVGDSLEKEMICLYGKFTDFNSNAYSFTYNSGNATKSIQLDSNATIILNGKIASFTDLAKLAGTNMTISTVACDQQVIVAHNKVTSFTGKEFVVTHYEPRKDYTLVYLANGDYIIPFCITENTSVYGGTVKLGCKVNILSDGCELIEVKVL